MRTVRGVAEGGESCGGYHSVARDHGNCATLSNVPHGMTETRGKLMAAQITLEFDGVTKKEYDAVNNALGVDYVTGEGDWPKGLLMHAAGIREDGHFVVTEIWDTVAHQEKFMNERLGEALAKGGVTAPPTSVTWLELFAHIQMGN
jgi:hypothetical protein